MRYRILFKNKVENAITKDVVVEERYLLTQLEILIRSGYQVISARIVEGE